MGEMGGPGGVVKVRDLVGVDGRRDQVLGGKDPEDRRGRQTSRVLDHGRGELVRERILVGQGWIHPRVLDFPNNERSLGSQEERSLGRGQVVGSALRRGRPPRERPLAGMSELSRPAEEVGARRHHRAVPAPDLARDCLVHGRGNRRQGRFRAENPQPEDRGAAQFPA
jgi:hypothetical protein